MILIIIWFLVCILIAHHHSSIQSTEDALQKLMIHKSSEPSSHTKHEIYRIWEKSRLIPNTVLKRLSYSVGKQNRCEGPNLDTANNNKISKW
jgi:hypothetical protein